MKASSSSCGLKSGMKLSRSGEGTDAGGLCGLCGAWGGLFGPPKEGCSRFGLFGLPKGGCSRFGLGLGFPKSTKEPTGGEGRVGCLGGKGSSHFDMDVIEDGDSILMVMIRKRLVILGIEAVEVMTTMMMMMMIS